MKPSLYEHMPYGAPELIESRETHLSRATFLATAMTVAILAAVGAVVTHLPRTISVPPSVTILPEIYEPTLPPADPAPKFRAPQPGPASPAADATPLPVPDAMAPTDDPLHGDLSEPSPSTVPGTTTGVPDAAPVSESLPAFDIFTPVERLPVAVREVKPIYPSIAEQAGVEGRVTVRVLVGKEGRVLDARVVQSVPMLDEAATVAARQWVFTPALNNDHAVACWVSIPFVFRLR